MLTQIIIINFKSHKETIIDLVPGVNIIVGRGQAGKTNIKRALEWLNTLRPLGTKVHSWWMGKGDHTLVAVRTSEGHYVEAKKPFNTSVSYRIEWADGTIDTFDAVGTKVPDKVKQVLNLGDLNLQGQLDQPYLVTSGNSEISKVVNKVVDLEVADQWLSVFNSKRLSNTQTVNKLKVDVKTGLATLEAYNPLDAAETALVAAEVLQGKLFSKQRIAAELAQAIRQVRNAQAEAAKAEPFGEAEQILEQAQQVRDEMAGLVAAREVCENIQENAEAWRGADADETELARQYVQLMQELKMCPTCFGPVDDKTVKRIAREL